MAPKDETPVLNFLRGLSIATFPFAFALSIAYASTAGDALFPTIALLPQTASAVFSIAILYFNKKRKAHRHVEFEDGSEDRRRRARNAAAFVADFSLFASLFTCMMFTWLHLVGAASFQRCYWCYNSTHEAILGTYATVAFMINMTIHLFFALRAIYISLPKEWLEVFRPGPATCPHCHHDLNSRATPAETDPAWLAGNNPARYSLLNPEENDSLYRDVERQTGKAFQDAERGEGARKPSEETAREIAVGDVAKIVDVDANA